MTARRVDSASRGLGIGHELLRRVGGQALARGSTHLALDVDSQNRQTLAFLEHLGSEERREGLRQRGEQPDDRKVTGRT
jgi:ribosomal protein S18 acetylase RimI-like enzyme